MKNKAFKDMGAQYQNGLYPYCPKFREMFDPVKLTRWGNPGKEMKKNGQEAKRGNNGIFEFPRNI